MNVEIQTTEPSEIIYKKGELHLHLSLPHINSFCIKPPSESYKSSFGFWGVSAGLDYYHSQSQFINVSASGVMDSHTEKTLGSLCTMIDLTQTHQHETR